MISRRALLAASQYPLFGARRPDWQELALQDGKQDRTTMAYDGIKPNSMVCDTTLRELPDGTWILFILAGGVTEPSPLNYTGVTRSRDKGKTWTPLAPLTWVSRGRAKPSGRGRQNC
jgi:hypothetical protein